MSITKRLPKALELADALEFEDSMFPAPSFGSQAATLLRSQHALIEELVEALREFADGIVPNDPADPMWVNARAAIANASAQP